MGLVCSAACGAISAVFCACNMIKCCCTGAMGAGGLSPALAKLGYVLLLAAGTVVAFLVGKFGQDAVEKDFSLKDIEIYKFTVTCQDVTGQDAVCSGDSAVLRASFGSVLFFAIMFIGTFPTPTCSGERRWGPLLSEGFHRGFWGLKILAYAALVIGAFFMKFFDDDKYTGVARFVSMLFLALQVLVLIDFAYVWNDTWLERSGIDSDFSDGSKCWLYSLLAITAGLFIAAFGGLIVLFIFYKNCTDTLAFAIVNFIFVIIFIVLTVFREQIVGEQGSIAPAAVVSAYTVYLTWSAAQSNPDLSKECDPFGLQLGKNAGEIFIGLAIGTFTLVWTAFTISKNSSNLLEGTADSNNRPEVSGAYEIQEADGTTKYAADATPAQNLEADHEDNSAEATGDKLHIFHLIMVTASFYMSMSLTNWGVSEAEVEINGSQVGNISMYVKMVANWVASLLFIWTLIAPAVMPDREWS